MAKVTKQPVRVVAGLHREHKTYFRITIYDNNSIRIERPFCSLATRQEWPTLDEDNWTPHYHLIHSIIPFKTNQL
ncbi:hypothetical protein GGR92_000012 [Spirosoma lacussanchae]|uniref:hypothetical protein n=1 Tax=Spirosoma lacussanchae TaxID=1884249 RepID=UPI0011095F84|nr:hypothetical protein [Spirosoma lacussanchae]